MGPAARAASILRNMAGCHTLTAAMPAALADGLQGTENLTVYAPKGNIISLLQSENISSIVQHHRAKYTLVDLTEWGFSLAILGGVPPADLSWTPEQLAASPLAKAGSNVPASQRQGFDSYIIDNVAVSDLATSGMLLDLAPLFASSEYYMDLLGVNKRYRRQVQGHGAHASGVQRRSRQHASVAGPLHAAQ